MSRLQANFLLLLAGAIWGGAFVAQSTAMENVGPFLFIALRFFVASLVVLPFALRESRQVVSRNRPLLTVREYWQFSTIGIALFVGMATQQVGLLTTSVTNSGFITGLYVVFTPFLAVLIFRDWPHRVVWPAALLSLAGIHFLSGGDIGNLKTGDFLTMISALCWGLQVVLIARYVGRSERPLALSITQFMVTGALAALVAVFTEPLLIDSIVKAAPEILYAGVMGSGVAFTFQVIGQRYTTAPQAAIFLSSEALFAALFGALWLGDRIGLLGAVGCALIFSAMLAVELVPMWGKRKEIALIDSTHND